MLSSVNCGGSVAVGAGAASSGAILVDADSLELADGAASVVLVDAEHAVSARADNKMIPPIFLMPES